MYPGTRASATAVRRPERIARGPMSDWLARDYAVLWHPFTQAREWMSYDPLVVESAHGFFLVDTNGREYLDGVSSLWCNVHGHRVPAIDRARTEAEALFNLLGGMWGDGPP